jgi:hypothetical protein
LINQCGHLPPKEDNDETINQATPGNQSKKSFEFEADKKANQEDW